MMHVLLHIPKVLIEDAYRWVQQLTLREDREQKEPPNFFIKFFAFVLAFVLAFCSLLFVSETLVDPVCTFFGKAISRHCNALQHTATLVVE